MNIFKKSALALALGLPLLAPEQLAAQAPLTVSGNRVLSGGKSVSFAGNSYFWSNTGWGAERFYNAETVKWLKDDWKSSIVRVAMGVGPEGGGYVQDPAANKARVKKVVDAAIAQGLYVIIDFHTHNADQYKSQSIEFFKEMARTYGNTNNVIYEVFNEPLGGASWDNTVKPYAEAVIKEIRAIDPDNLIVVGTPTWSQDVDVASRNPIKGYANIAYTLHFYAASHKQDIRNKATVAMNNGIALMVTEWSPVNYDGNGAGDFAETETWMKFLKDNGISHCIWSVHDKNEGASILANTSSGRPAVSSTGGWSNSDLSPVGQYLRGTVRNWGSSVTPPTNPPTPPTNPPTPPTNPPTPPTNPPTPPTNPPTPPTNPPTPPPSTKQSPYAGVIQLPGTLQAENYDNGGEGVAYHDQDVRNYEGAIRGKEAVEVYNSNAGTPVVGWTVGGEWLEYTVNVRQAGSYKLDARVTSPSASGRFRLELNGRNVSGTVNVPNTGGWGKFRSVTKTLKLTAGQQVLRIFFEQGGFDLDKLTFSAQTNGGGTTPPPTTGTAPVAGKIYRLVSRKSGLVLDVNGCSGQDNANVQQSTWQGKSCQRWKLADARTAGYVQLIAQHSNKALDLFNCDTNVQQLNIQNNDCQMWKLVPTGNGYYKLQTRWNNKVLEVASCSNATGANVQAGSDQNNDCQQWKFEEVGSANRPVADLEATAATGQQLLQVFPNPAQDQVTVSVPALHGAAQLTVHNALGKLVQKLSVEGAGPLNLNTAGLTPGVYLLTVRGGGLDLSQKLVIE